MPEEFFGYAEDAPMESAGDIIAANMPAYESAVIATPTVESWDYGTSIPVKDSTWYSGLTDVFGGVKATADYGLKAAQIFGSKAKETAQGVTATVNSTKAQLSEAKKSLQSISDGSANQVRPANAPNYAAMIMPLALLLGGIFVFKAMRK